MAIKNIKPPKQSEDALQMQCVQWYRYQYGDSRLYMNYNNPRSAVAGVKLKRMGMRAGVADLSLMLPDGRIAYIELKTATGRQSPAQIEFAEDCAALGAPYHLVRTLDAFVEVVTALLAANYDVPK